MNTDERGFVLAKNLKTKSKILNGTRMNAGTGKGNNGRREDWNDGQKNKVLNPLFQHSSIPICFLCVICEICG
jgi:hypothetical protein